MGGLDQLVRARSLYLRSVTGSSPVSLPKLKLEKFF